MPEEINRVVTDRVSDLLLCHCDEALDNLAAEGMRRDRMAMVGNTMIDSLFSLLPAAQATGAVASYGLQPSEYVLVTLHRPALVDVPERLDEVIEVLAEVAAQLPVVFPLHPRTRERLGAPMGPQIESLMLLDPLEYLEFIDLESRARFVVTDSGGVQEETTSLGVPCLTYRSSTERPVTVTLGSNRLVGLDPGALRAACAEMLNRPARTRPARSIPFWDGCAGERAASAITAFLEGRVSGPASPAGELL